MTGKAELLEGLVLDPSQTSDAFGGIAGERSLADD